MAGVYQQFQSFLRYTVKVENDKYGFFNYISQAEKYINLILEKRELIDI